MNRTFWYISMITFSFFAISVLLYFFRYCFNIYMSGCILLLREACPRMGAAMNVAKEILLGANSKRRPTAAQALELLEEELFKQGNVRTGRRPTKMHLILKTIYRSCNAHVFCGRVATSFQTSQHISQCRSNFSQPHAGRCISKNKC